MDRQKIREVIVVEGKHDTQKLKMYFDCETIETNGTHLGKEVLDRIRQARDTAGVIVFTDPDSPGNRIRSAVNTAVPGCRNAFIDKDAAKTEKKVGIEHAGKEDLQEALAHLVTWQETARGSLTAADMSELGLLGRPDSEEKRRKLGIVLHIGYGNAKTMRQRLNRIEITKEELKRILEE